MVFRWTVWGPNTRLFELASYSVGTFRNIFGSAARYVVCTDQPAAVTRLLDRNVDVIPMRESVFDIPAKAPWRKWAPLVRIAPGDTEIYVDSDVFLIGEPDELREFASGHPGNRVLAMPESSPDRRMYGVFHERLPLNAPGMNSGLVGQQ